MKSSCELLSKNTITLKNLFCKKSVSAKTSQKLIYRQDGVTVDKLIITDFLTGNVIKIIRYSYLDAEKISSVEEFEDGVKIRETTPPYGFIII